MIKRKYYRIGFMALLFLIGATSCEYSYSYSYIVTNKCDAPINVNIKTFKEDSVYEIGVNESKVLYVTEHGIEGSKGPYFRDVVMDLDVFLVEKNDTLKSNKDFLENDRWSFNKGNYSTTIINDDF